jgi:hypothetical protein
MRDRCGTALELSTKSGPAIATNEKAALVPGGLAFDAWLSCAGPGELAPEVEFDSTILSRPARFHSANCQAAGMTGPLGEKPDSKGCRGFSDFLGSFLRRNDPVLEPRLHLIRQPWNLLETATY